MAITSLVLGVASFPAICCYGVPAVALGITALILGRVSLRRIRASAGMLGGEGLAQAGWITGIIGGVLGVIYLLGMVGIYGFSLYYFLTHPHVTPGP
ncbi:MAG TPA: DUF4190 domain-containing protein [Candidatus Dormibacteraeota bacterium]|nr:DUF4190 domain-containing protein [Candidatus Dormibacteraeota bacterium]